MECRYRWYDILDHRSCQSCGTPSAAVPCARIIGGSRRSLLPTSYRNLRENRCYSGRNGDNFFGKLALFRKIAGILWENRWYAMEIGWYLLRIRGFVTLWGKWVLLFEKWVRFAKWVFLEKRSADLQIRTDCHKKSYYSFDKTNFFRRRWKRVSDICMHGVAAHQHIHGTFMLLISRSLCGTRGNCRHGFYSCCVVSCVNKLYFSVVRDSACPPINEEYFEN
ncbi:hypothetical protein J6590_007342 [Homalodisca vitripennis]|nr:hypothetical protein J6590_007342 [Homalodisca vitripennis]